MVYQSTKWMHTYICTWKIPFGNPVTTNNMKHYVIIVKHKKKDRRISCQECICSCQYYYLGTNPIQKYPITKA